jgi:hypothetical protein
MRALECAFLFVTLAATIHAEESLLDASAELQNLVHPKVEVKEAHLDEFKAGPKLGEAAKMPGPFSEVPTESIGTEGYTVHHNKYNDLDTTTKGIACNGDIHKGKAQSYQVSEGDPPDVSICRNKCNACAGCVGFVDMTGDQTCHFMTGMDLTKVQISHGIEKYKKYFNKVKSYIACAPGQWSPNEAATCTDCKAGFFNTKAKMGKECFGCAAGTMSAAKAGSCTTCAAGKRSEKELMSTKCVDCKVAEYAHERSHVCTPCPSGSYSTAGALISSGRNESEYGKDQTGMCLDCPAGKYTGEGTKFTSCLACVPGKFSEKAAETCTECYKGTNMAAAGASTCTDCAAGKHAPGRGYTACPGCPGGRHAGVGKSECAACAKGKASVPGQAACTACIVGKHADVTGLPACKNCPPGFFTGATEVMLLIT